MTYPQSCSSDSFDGDKPAQAPSRQAIQQQLSTATVPATPGMDSPNSTDASASIPRSLIDRSGVSVCPNLERGTPLAVGAFNIQKSFATPFRTQKPSKLSASFTFSSPMVSLKKRECIETTENVPVISSDSEEESEREEARLLLNVARAQRYLRQLEQDVIHAQLAENAVLSELYQFRASQSQKKLDATEYDLGCLRNTIRKSGISLADVPSARKRRRMSNETSVAGMSDSHSPGV
ncbi:hypothetical protein JVT61DRAFT_14579 [Boletus reticuloceps]|uniref:Uncharacterized protein n=1 Tax=Boletus reticuloceps TaxID=495285 RepID=A0A8I2YTE6_9AGAM|nr:hypothetical protein JVT61DRAFT_14579 [Boletus reticuloceps]